jgi:hypothetical protein
MQKIIFKTSAQVYERIPTNWKDKGTPYALLGQVFRWGERYLEAGGEPSLTNVRSAVGSGKIIFEPAFLYRMIR